MARKLIDPEKKLKCILAVLQGGAEIKDEARRLSVKHQTMARFVAAYAKQYPEADKRLKATDPLPPPPPESAGAGPGSVSPEGSGAGASSEAGPAPADSRGLFDAAATKAAMEADGKLPGGSEPAKPGAGSLNLPPPPQAFSLDNSKEDLDVVEGISNQLMGHACRVAVFYMELRSGVRLPKSEMARIHELYVLTPTERAMLKPASAHLARKIRELIGSSEKVAYTVGGSTITGGLFDRWRTVTEAIVRQFEIQRPDLKAAAMEAERAASQAGGQQK